MVMVAIVVMLVGIAVGVIVIGSVMVSFRDHDPRRRDRDRLRPQVVRPRPRHDRGPHRRGMIVIGWRRRLGKFFGVIVEQIKTFDIDEHGTIVRRAGRRQHANDGERIVLVSVGGAVRRLERAAHGQAGFAGRRWRR